MEIYRISIMENLLMLLEDGFQFPCSGVPDEYTSTFRAAGDVDSVGGETGMHLVVIDVKSIGLEGTNNLIATQLDRVQRVISRACQNIVVICKYNKE